MNELVRSCSVSEADILSPNGANVRVVGRPHPMRATRVDVMMPAGLSVAEMLDLAKVGFSKSGMDGEYIIHINGLPVPREWWARVRPKQGATVVFQPTFRNSRTLIGLAVAVAAFVVAGPLGGTIAGAFSVTSAIGISLITSAVMTGVCLGGGICLRALVPERRALEHAPF